MKTRISFAEVEAVLEEIRRINSIPFDDIEWIDDEGNVVNIPKEIADDFKDTGLSNKDFVRYDFLHTVIIYNRQS